ncbi:MAG: PLP-dependent aminotransferase family protein [Gemmatimonadetes bacterium]|nr:PLP-dependent aminotransferase family protein [Gemmatimonadota bacterium]
MSGRRPRASRRGAPLQVPVTAGPEPSPLYTQVYREIREHILSGVLRPGARLPSARTLAADLGVSRNTIEAAFLQLGAEGFITRRVGAGTTVASSMGESAPFRARPRRAGTPRAEAPRSAALRLSARGTLITECGLAEIAGDHPAGPCATEVAGFPVRTWNRLLARRARRAGIAPFQAADPAGLPALREAIADHVRVTRGVRCEWRQVIVVTSTQQALDLCGRLLLDPGAVALMEDPGYRGTRAALLAAGAEVRGVPVDGDGVDPEALAAHPGARLLYVTPSHQYPLGVTLTLARRLALLRWAAATGAWILEDDYDSEFRYDGRPLASLQGLDPEGRVIYLGTCNKVLFPGLRLGYVIVPPGLVAPFTAARRISDGFSPPLVQAVLADFISGGHFAAWLRQARQHYAACRDALVASITTQWGPAVTLGPSDTGLHLMAHLPDGAPDAAIAEAATAQCLGVLPLTRYLAAPSRRRGLLLSYVAGTPARIPADVAALAPAVRGRRGR